MAFKRVVNIIKKFGDREGLDEARLSADQERTLFRAARDVEDRVPALMEQDDYETLIEMIVGLKPQVDAFFDHVLVDDPDPDVKSNRLALLTRVAGLFELAADFSKIST